MQSMWGIPPRIIFHNLNETLTGTVQGKKASDLEERTARALDKLEDWNYTFRIRINPVSTELSQRFTNMKGELEIDFLVRRGRTLVPILVDGEIGHFFTQWQKDVDNMKAAEIDDNMRKYGARPSIRVPYWELANQEMTDHYFRNLLT